MRESTRRKLAEIKARRRRRFSIAFGILLLPMLIWLLLAWVKLHARG